MKHFSPLKPYKILVLPSGGACGIIPSTILTQLEKDTGIPIYQYFNEVWCSSIGSVTAALLTTPQRDSKGQPRSASEVTQFLEHTFSYMPRALQIRGQLKKLIPSNTFLKDTLIPIRILSAEVIQSKWNWPTRTRLKIFSPETHGDLPLNSIVASSCTVFPVHFRAERIQTQESSFIDAGCEVCTESCMNPLGPILNEFSNHWASRLNLGDHPITIYFMSNGWVRLASQPIKENFDLHNLDAHLERVIEDWQNHTFTGKFLRPLCNPFTLYNLIGAGLIPSTFLIREGLRVCETSAAYQALVSNSPSPL